MQLRRSLAGNRQPPHVAAHCCWPPSVSYVHVNLILQPPAQKIGCIMSIYLSGYAKEYVSRAFDGIERLARASPAAELHMAEVAC